MNLEFSATSLVIRMTILDTALMRNLGKKFSVNNYTFRIVAREQGTMEHFAGYNKTYKTILIF